MPFFGRPFGAAFTLAVLTASPGTAFIYDEDMQGDCTLCPPVLAADVGGEVEWSVDHIGFSMDEEIWDDIVGLLDDLIDKIPGDPGPGDPDPGDPDPGNPGGPGPGTGTGDEETQQNQAAPQSNGEAIVLIEPLKTPVWRREGERVFAEYQLPVKVTRLSQAVRVSKDILIWADRRTGRAVAVAAGSYKIARDGRLRISLKPKKLR